MAKRSLNAGLMKSGVTNLSSYSVFVVQPVAQQTESIPSTPPDVSTPLDNLSHLCICRQVTTYWSYRALGSQLWCSRSRWSSPSRSLRWFRSPSRPWRWCRPPLPRYRPSHRDSQSPRAYRSLKQIQHQHRYPLRHTLRMTFLLAPPWGWHFWFSSSCWTD